MHIINNSN